MTTPRRAPAPFDLEEGISLLARTPEVLRALLSGLPSGWVEESEGEGTWSPFDVVGHLIHGERTDWMPRARIILERGEERTFEPFDRFAMLEASRGRSIDDLLAEFAALRAENLAALRALDLGPDDLERTGRHPELGRVTLGQLLATWVAHDLGHLAQIGRVMMRRYREAVGPWRAFMSLLRDAD